MGSVNREDYPPSVEAMLKPDGNAPTASLEDFVAVYSKDENVWWQIGCGHHMNLFDAALDRLGM